MSNVVFINTTQNYPFRFSAGNTKMEFIAKGLKETKNSYNIFVINDLIGNKENMTLLSGKRNEIYYFCLPRRKNILFTYIQNLFWYVKKLYNIRKNSERNFIFNDTVFYPQFILEIFIAKILGYKLVSICHEWHISFPHKGIKRLSNYIFDKTFGYFSQGILPISSYLEKKVAHFNKPMLRLPILADFKTQKKVCNTASDSYFVFCGHALYSSTIKLILESHKIIINKGYSAKLILILSGSKKDLQHIQDRITQYNLTQFIEIKTNIPHNELTLLYENALALLIPLSPHSVQDQARFSQKIAEYLCSQRPIITVNTGEIPYYFENRVTAFIANKFTPEELHLELETVIKDTNLSNEVGLSGFKLGQQKFDYRSNGERVHRFLSSL
jgi:glycosyltransferase involved in cell wall biosynthesis